MSHPILEAGAVGALVAGLGFTSLHACGSVAPQAAYVQVRDVICEAGEQFPASPEREKLLEVCKAETTVRECAEAFEGLAATVER